MRSDYSSSVGSKQPVLGPFACSVIPSIETCPKLSFEDGLIVRVRIQVHPAQSPCQTLIQAPFRVTSATAPWDLFVISGTLRIVSRARRRCDIRISARCSRLPGGCRRWMTLPFLPGRWPAWPPFAEDAFPSNTGRFAVPILIDSGFPLFHSQTKARFVQPAA
jgi:hypothetical protein